MRIARARLAAGRSSAVLVLAALTVGLAGGCGLFGGSRSAGDKAAAEKALPPDSPAALRQDVDRLRADITDLRTRVDAAQRADTEHADRVAQETRAEFDAVQKAIEASARNDMQRQIEVLDAQARRIDLLEKRAAELGQSLRRIELSLGGLESQLSRILDGAPPAAGAKGGAAGRAPAAAPARPADEFVVDRVLAGQQPVRGRGGGWPHAARDARSRAGDADGARIDGRRGHDPQADGCGGRSVLVEDRR